MSEESLQEQFRRLQWEGKYEEAQKIEIQIFCSAWKNGNRIGAFSARSSFFYSWAGNVLKRGGKLALLGELPVRLWKFYRLMKYARIASDNMLHETGFRHELTADQLDVRSSVYLRLWNMGGRINPFYRREVLQCVDAALTKQNMKPHTRALLHITHGQIRGSYRSSEGRQDYAAVEKLIPAIRESGELKQLVRVYRHLANYYKKADAYSKELEYTRLAQETAAEAGAIDQLIKMGVQT